MKYFDDETSEPYLRRVEVRLAGAGANAPTKLLGQSITVGRSGQGVYTLTLREPEGTYAGHSGVALEANTPGNLKNHSVVLGAYNAATRSITVNLFDAAGAAHDLAADEFLTFALRFKQRSV